MRILSKSQKRKSKKGVSWAQGGRNRKVISQIKQALREIEGEDK
jgi:hypothetical protein